MKTEALTTEIPVEPGMYWIRKPGMKLLFKIELKLEDEKLFISGEPGCGGFAGRIIIADYPLGDCEDGTEWMTVEEAGEAY